MIVPYPDHARRVMLDLPCDASQSVSSTVRSIDII
jgi:hypothetical protein